MKGSQPTQKGWKKLPFPAIGIILILAFMIFFLWFNTTNSMQSLPAIFPDIDFEGQYRIGDGDWLTVKDGKHISSTQGVVTLKGRFHMTIPGGEYLGPVEAGIPLMFYTNHIHITIQEGDQEPIAFDMESDYAGKSLCGEFCDRYEVTTGEPITLTFHNNHKFGNETAIDDFLRELSVYEDSSLEKDFSAEGNLERTLGLFFVIASFVLLSTAAFSSALHVKDSDKLWLISLCVFFAGVYFAYGSKGVFFWSESIIANTTILGICMMMYSLCIGTLIVSTFDSKRRKIGFSSVLFSGIASAAIVVFCLFSDARFYDCWLWWLIAQSIVNAMLLVCLVTECHGASKGKIFCNTGAIILLLGFEVDFAATAFGWWQGGLISRHIFVLLFIAAIVLVWQTIPRNIKAARIAQEMEAEQKAIRAQLQENRIAIMISQIQPHFIYNTLGTIQQLCKEDPEQASKLVHRFSMYLRGNFSELDNATPIRFMQELEHVRCYTEIELVRFPDMTVHYDIQVEEFLLPALTVQPLVENAIKHGLMGLEEGGTVTIKSFETETHYCVTVSDDGVGFDENIPLDKRKHVGIRNVRERLQMMCGGELTVESQVGKGTVALIQIPKEEKKV